LWLSDEECTARDEAGVLETLTSQSIQAVILESEGRPEPELCGKLRTAGIEVQLVSGVSGEGLLRAYPGEREAYVEPIYLRGFT
jgi:hypothetical protein